MTLSRGVPIKKAMEPNNLLVWAMNGQPPLVHGCPLRLVIPGWPGSVSQKWLKLWVRDKPHDGQGMGGTSYRVPIKPIVPGSNDDGKPSAISNRCRCAPSSPIPRTARNWPPARKELKLRGAAWAGDHKVRAVAVSVDFGATWQKAKLARPKNRYDWRRWTATVKLPSDGYYEVWARATDSRGVTQPHVAGNWNPQGYGGNPMHRIAVLVG